MGKKSIIVIIILVVVAIAAVAYSMSKGTKTADQVKAPISKKQPAPEQPKKVEVTNVETTKLPDRFPADIPVEQGAIITYNYNAINAAGKFQASREFISKKTMDENFTFYQDTLKKAGWTVSSAIDDTAHTQKIILASKGGNSLNIRIYTDNGKVKVSINNETQP